MAPVVQVKYCLTVTEFIMDKKLSQSVDLADGMGDMEINTGEAVSIESPKNDGNDSNDSNDGGSPITKHDLVEMNEEERKALTEEQELSVKDSVKKMEEIAESLQTLLLNADGTAVDFSDKAGRLYLVQGLKNFKGAVDKLPENIQGQVLEGLPKSVALRFTDEDREKIEFLRKWQKHLYWIAITYFVVTSIVCFIACRMSAKANVKVKQAEELVEKNRDAAIFGNYMKKLNPKTWNKYMNNDEFRKEVYKENDTMQ